MSGWGVRVDAWFRAACSPTTIALLRVAVGMFALVYVIVRAPHLWGFERFSPTQFQPVGVVSLLSHPLPTWVATVLVFATAVAGMAFVLGWRFRVLGPVFALLLLWVTSYRNSWGMIFHTENLMVLHVLVLGFARSADACSWDARGRSFAIDAAYRWPVRLMAMVTVATYVVAGVAKLRNAGSAWIDGEVLRNYVAYDNLRKVELGSSHSWLGVGLLAQSWMFGPLAILTLLVELLAPLALAGGGFALVWSIAAWGFHAGVVLLMAIVFPYPLLGLAFAPLFDLETVVPRVAAWWSNWRS